MNLTVIFMSGEEKTFEVIDYDYNFNDRCMYLFGDDGVKWVISVRQIASWYVEG